MDDQDYPRTPLIILRWFCNPKYHPDIEGDLLEMYDRRVQTMGLTRAKWLLVKDILLLFRPGIIRAYSSNHQFMVRENLKIAGRQILRNKVFASINLAGLTVGMTTALLSLIWVQNEWSFDRFYPDAQKIYRIICHWEGSGEHLTVPQVPIQLCDLAREEISEIEELFILALAWDYPLIKTSTSEFFEENDLAYISDNWLDQFGYLATQGSIENFRANKFGMALTEERARKFFGMEDPIGQTVELYSTSYTVELVFKENPVNSSFKQRVFIPLASYWPHRLTYEEEIRSHNYKFVAFFKASDQLDSEMIELQLTGLMERIDSKPTSISIFPLVDMRFKTQFSGDIFDHKNGKLVHTFALIAILILLAAILNYINFSTAQINQRVAEIGTRKIIGATSLNIFSQIITETVVICLLSFIAALAASYYFMPYLADYTDLDLSLDFSNKYIWIVLLLVLIMATLIAAIYPGLLHAGVRPIHLIQKRGGNEKGLSMRGILMVGQFTAAIIVLIGTVVIYKQLQFIQEKDVGYDRSQVMSVPLKYNFGDDHWENADRFDNFKNEIEKIAEFEAVAITDANVANIHKRNSGTLSWEGKAKDQSVIVSQLRANADLHSIFDFEMEEGRWFTNDSKDFNNIIMNRTAVREFDIPEPVVGRASSFQGRDGQIVGVVEDFIFSDLHSTIEPLVIWHNQGRGSMLLAKVQPIGINQTLVKVEGIFNEIFPEKTFEYTFLDQSFRQMHEADLKLNVLLRIFTGLLLFISCLGILGLTLFEAQRRRKEIAIRKVLGAGVFGILKQLSKQYFLLIAIAFLIAMPVAAFFIQKWLNNFAFHIDLQWWFFIIPGISAALIATAAMSFYNMKAALANPVHDLRE